MRDVAVVDSIGVTAGASTSAVGCYLCIMRTDHRAADRLKVLAAAGAVILL
jgi:hypothetical protein